MPRRVSGRQEDRGAKTALGTLVRGVRRKRGDSATEPVHIRTVRRVGYRMPRPDGR